jgi:hypothetical protein
MFSHVSAFFLVLLVSYLENAKNKKKGDSCRIGGFKVVGIGIVAGAVRVNSHGRKTALPTRLLSFNHTRSRVRTNSKQRGPYKKLRGCEFGCAKHHAAVSLFLLFWSSLFFFLSLDTSHPNSSVRMCTSLYQRGTPLLNKNKHTAARISPITKGKVEEAMGTVLQRENASIRKYSVCVGLHERKKKKNTTPQTRRRYNGKRPSVSR